MNLDGSSGLSGLKFGEYSLRCRGSRVRLSQSTRGYQQAVVTEKASFNRQNAADLLIDADLPLPVPSKDSIDKRQEGTVES